MNLYYLITRLAILPNDDMLKELEKELKPFSSFQGGRIQLISDYNFTITVFDQCGDKYVLYIYDFSGGCFYIKVMGPRLDRRFELKNKYSELKAKYLEYLMTEVPYDHCL